MLSPVAPTSAPPQLLMPYCVAPPPVGVPKPRNVTVLFETVTLVMRWLTIEPLSQKFCIFNGPLPLPVSVMLLLLIVPLPLLAIMICHC
jgi:hypothetical protein